MKTLQDKWRIYEIDEGLEAIPLISQGHAIGRKSLKDFMGWTEKGKTLRDGRRRGRLYGMDGEGEDFTGWMEKGKTLRDGWRRGRHYGMDGEGEDFMRLMGVWGQRPQQAEAVL